MIQFISSDQLPENFIQSVRDKSRADERKTEEFQKRTGLFTASELHKLFTSAQKRAENETARNYIASKAWERVTGCAATWGGGSQATDWGHEHEPLAIIEFEKRTGKTVQFVGDNQQFFKAEGYNFGATLDGILDDNTIFEAKCPFNGGNHLHNIKYGASPEWFRKNRFDYWIQIQAGMWAAKRKFCVFASFDPGTSREKYAPDRRTFDNFDHLKLWWNVFERDEATIKEIQNVLTEAEKLLIEAIPN